jgi:hypothetical protein
LRARFHRHLPSISVTPTNKMLALGLKFIQPTKLDVTAPGAVNSFQKRVTGVYSIQHIRIWLKG